MVEKNVADIVSQFHKQLLTRIDDLEKENEILTNQLKKAEEESDINFYFDPNEDCYVFSVGKTLYCFNEDLKIEAYQEVNYEKNKSELDIYMEKNGYETKNFQNLKKISIFEFFNKWVKFYKI